uniref:Uncharacterized protein n=1 Tax=Rhodnius prolixus TaxID=13249 RepID=T1IG37_RHOPR
MSGRKKQNSSHPNVDNKMFDQMYTAIAKARNRDIKMRENLQLLDRRINEQSHQVDALIDSVNTSIQALKKPLHQNINPRAIGGSTCLPHSKIPTKYTMNSPKSNR